MRKPTCVTACILTCLVSNIGIAGPPDSPLLLTHAIEVHARQLSRDAPTTTHRSGAMGTQLRQCRSKKKGAIIGATVGAAAGGVFALYVSGAASGVPGVAQGAARYVTYWMIGGAGVGALGGDRLLHRLAYVLLPMNDVHRRGSRALRPTGTPQDIERSPPPFNTSSVRARLATRRYQRESYPFTSKVVAAGKIAREAPVPSRSPLGL
jgi:hypothetical protein